LKVVVVLQFTMVEKPAGVGIGNFGVDNGEVDGGADGSMDGVVDGDTDGGGEVVSSGVISTWRVR
jgi:hypothetical protein